MIPSTLMRLYGEKEVSALLRRAAELQATQQGPPTNGLTLDELRQIAGEAGIDPRFVELAAREVTDRPLVQEEPSFWGGPFTIVEERLIEGEISEDEWGTMVGELRRTFGKPGMTSKIGRTYEWTHALYGSTYQHVSLTPERGKMRLRVEHKMHNESAVYIAPALFVIFPIISGIALLAGKAAAFPIFIVATLLAVLSFWGARAGYRSLTQKARKKVQTLAHRLEVIAGEEEAGHREAIQNSEPRTTAPQVEPERTSQIEIPEERAADLASHPRERTRN